MERSIFYLKTNGDTEMAKKQIVEVTADVEVGGGKLEFKTDALPHDLQEYLKQGHQVQLTRHLSDGRAEFTIGDFVLRVTAIMSFKDAGAILNELLSKTDYDWKRVARILSLALAEASYHSKTNTAEVYQWLKQARAKSLSGG